MTEVEKMPANRKANDSRRLTVAGLIAVTAATLLMMAWAIFPSAAFADGTVTWTGQGSEHNTPCDRGEQPGFHWVFTVGGGQSAVTSASLTVNDAGPYPMSPNPQKTQWDADVVSGVVVSASVAYVGTLGTGQAGLRIPRVLREDHHHEHDLDADEHDHQGTIDADEHDHQGHDLDADEHDHQGHDLDADEHDHGPGGGGDGLTTTCRPPRLPDRRTDDGRARRRPKTERGADDGVAPRDSLHGCRERRPDRRDRSDVDDERLRPPVGWQPPQTGSEPGRGVTKA